MSRFVQAFATAAQGDRGMTTGEPRAAVRVTWAQVHDEARRGAEVLAARGLRPGDAVAILAARPAEVAPAAQAVWLAGGSVTMLHQPTARTDLARYAQDTLAVLGVINARLVIVGEPFADAVGMLDGTDIGGVTVADLLAGVGSADPKVVDPIDVDPINVDEDSTALLQLTSGSTATPKAVRITHRNLWCNIEAMIAAADLSAQRDVMVSWLPLFHDMGMVGFLTLPMCRGIELVTVTPVDFLSNPLLWPELISRYHGTCTAAPNFAYALTARVLARANDLDLSTLRFALNGAEPIDVAAVRSFLAAGARFGLSDTAVVCAYGMAEATLGVSFHPWGTPLAVDTVDAAALENERRAVPVEPGVDTPTRNFPLLGPPLAGIEVSVFDPTGAALGERQVGVLHIRGEAVTELYLTVDGPVPTRGRDGWLDTGDIGYLVDGRVVVCGRAKDVIIMGGRNILPTDIERIAESVEGVRAGNAAALRLAAGDRRESFAVLVESRSAGDPAETTRIAGQVRAAITAAMGVRPARVMVLPPGSLPKTPSGKIRRSAAAALLD